MGFNIQHCQKNILVRKLEVSRIRPILTVFFLHKLKDVLFRSPSSTGKNAEIVRLDQIKKKLKLKEPSYRKEVMYK